MNKQKVKQPRFHFQLPVIFISDVRGQLRAPCVIPEMKTFSVPNPLKNKRCVDFGMNDIVTEDCANTNIKVGTQCNRIIYSCQLSNALDKSKGTATQGSILDWDIFLTASLL